MEATVGEVFEFAVETNLSLVAHGIYWAMGQGLVGPGDRADAIRGIRYDEEEVGRLEKENRLSLGRIKLYAIKAPAKEAYAFYFAEHSLDVYRLHEEKFRESDVAIRNADRLLMKVMACAVTGQEEFLYERRSRFAEYPAYIGHAWAGEAVIHQL